MKYSTYFILSCLILVGGCAAESSSLLPKEKQRTTKNIKRIAPIVSYETLGDMGIYQSMLDTTMNTIYIHEMRMDQKYERIYRGIDFHNVNIEKPEEFMQQLKVNGSNPFLKHDQSKDFFGKTLRFSYGDETKQSTYTADDDFVSTSSIHITSPDVNQAEQNTPLCFAGDFVVCWDSDSTNVDGIVIGVRWTGTMIFGDNYPDTEVVCLETFPDTGSATLSPQIFSSIPDTAYCQLIVLRGNTGTVSLDNNLVRIVSESRDIIKFVLIKNIIHQESDDLCAE